MEINRPVDRRRELIDRGDTIFGIDEQPFPVERHHIDLKWLRFGAAIAISGDTAKPTIGIKQMRSHPCQRAKRDNNEQRSRPDAKFEQGRMIPIRFIGGLVVGLAVFPGKKDDQRHDRHNNEQHQAGGKDQQITFLNRDIAGRIQHDRFATTHD